MNKKASILHILHYIHVESKWLEAIITYIKANSLYIFRRDYPKYHEIDNSALPRTKF